MDDDELSEAESYSSMPPLESVADITDSEHRPPSSTQPRPAHSDSLPSYAARLDTPSPTSSDPEPVIADFVAEQFIFFMVADRVVSTNHFWA